MSNWDRFVFTFLNVDVARQYAGYVLAGLGVTIGIGVAVVATGVAAGLAMASVRSFGSRLANIPIVVFVDLFRSLPPLAIILVVYFGLPNLGIVMPSLVVLWLSLSCVLAAFAEEVFWAGITSVPPGQWLAARASGLTYGQALLHVILPQAARLAVPPLTNRAITITKNVALGSAIGVSEILGQAQSALALSSNATPLTIGAILYVLLFLPLIALSRSLERRWRWGAA